MLGEFLIVLLGSWILGMGGLFITMLYRLIAGFVNDPDNTPLALVVGRSTILLVALAYLTTVALMTQDFFFPARTPKMFKIKSAGPDSERKIFGIDTQIKMVS